MKILGLLRHAKSNWEPSDKRDFDRGLNDRGRRGAALIGQHIADQDFNFTRLIASPAERVKRTLESANLGLEPEFDERLYLAGADTIMDVLREKGGDADAVLIAGHNPGLGDMLFELIAPSNENALFDEAKVKFPTASFAVFELDIDDWADLRSECGTLAHFRRPRDLDPTLGPED